MRNDFFIINPVGTQSDFDITEEDDNGRNQRAKKRKMDGNNDQDKWDMYMYNFLSSNFCFLIF